MTTNEEYIVVAEPCAGLTTSQSSARGVFAPMVKHEIILFRWIELYCLLIDLLSSSFWSGCKNHSTADTLRLVLFCFAGNIVIRTGIRPMGPFRFNFVQQDKTEYTDGTECIIRGVRAVGDRQSYHVRQGSNTACRFIPTHRLDHFLSCDGDG